MTRLSAGITGILEVKNALGIDVRPALMIVRTLRKYDDTEVMFVHRNRFINARSVLEIMTLAAGFGDRLIVTANGSDAQKALDELSYLFEKKFDENAFYSSEVVKRKVVWGQSVKSLGCLFFS